MSGPRVVRGPRLPSSTVVAMDPDGMVHRTSGSCWQEDGEMVRCTVVQAMAFRTGVCHRCWPGGAPWTG